MKRLAPDLFDRRFSDLMEMGRARLPGLAPGWTDYNAHDPGVTLMELLAWVTEAQLYSLGRMRRDERAAYAALFGLTARGTEPARGLIWPDRLDPRAPASTYTQSVVIDADAGVSMLDAETPTFRPAAKLLWVPGSVRRLAAWLADGRVVDYTVINERGGPAFQPFGASAGPNDVLVMEFECRGDDGLFPPKRADAEGALLPIGVRADKSLTGDVADPGALFAPPSDSQETSSLTATLVTRTERVPLRIASDSTRGLLRTGALLLDLSAVKESATNFAIELRATRGFERPPRLLRIEPNVVPIVQGYSILDEAHDAPGNTDEPNGGAGLPDWSFQLNVPGLRFAPSEQPVKIEQQGADTNRRTEWRPGRLAESGPNDPVYELDTSDDRVTFGNGVNGRIPPTGATMLASYAVCDGAQGGVAANRKWQVQGFAGSFGVNVDAVGGGAAPTTSIDERREARRRARDDHALVSSGDIVSAALHLPLLEVARAWVLPPGDKAPRMGTANLVAMRARVSEQEAGGTPETRRWLEAIRRRLAPKMPLATRLVVTAPRYVGFSIRATIEVAAGRDPATIKGDIARELTQRLALTGPDARQPGVPVSKRDFIAWIRVVDGVQRVTSLTLLAASGAAGDEIKVRQDGLPRFDLAGSSIDVKRNGTRTAT
jgi:predicted phage baseplate assembly protein